MKKTNFFDEERLFFDLKNLYEGFGYKQFKMSKFEEYGVYLENKKFLRSPYVITFTDLNGKLMALKPDGTICFLGWAGRMCYHNRRDKILRIDYEKYIKSGWTVSQNPLAKEIYPLRPFPNSNTSHSPNRKRHHF